uniref:sensor histidine kinase n=1 Tax=Flavobacterium sp. TaxID=239 RepID=UPI00404B31BC
MMKVSLLVLLMSFSVFSQEIEYDNADQYLRNGDLQNATDQIQIAIKKARHNKSKYYQLYGTILKRTNIIDSSLYYYNLAEEDYKTRNVKDSLLLMTALKTEFYRFLNFQKETNLYTNKLNQFEFSQIKNKNIVAFALNRKMAVFSLYHYGSKDTLQMIKNIGKQIIDLDSQITKKDIVAYTLNELALLEDYFGEKSNAASKYEEALAYAKTNNLKNPEIDGSFVYAQYCSRYLNDNQKAITIVEAIKDKVLRGSNLFHKQKLFEELKNYYFLNGDYKKSFLTFEEFFKYYKEVDFSEALLKLNAIERKFNIAQKQKEIQDKEVEIKIQNLKIENSTKRFWLITVFFVITAFGSAGLYYYFKREQKANKELRILSKENDFLMSEANHRINNNLQLIIILISGQIEKLSQHENDEIKKILAKINSIATLHKHLYKSKNKREIDIQKYLKDIESSFSDLFVENNIISSFSTQQISLIIDDAMYIGLILTELYINSIKHAFEPNQINKQIVFSISLQDEDIVFSYMDNGKNFNSNPKTKPVLVDQLCRQLEVSYTINYTSGFELIFKKPITTINHK